MKALTRKHLRLGWTLLLLFLSLGVLLEAMHGFKVGWYLDVSNETRRLMWRLSHAHGVLLALVHIAFAFTCTMSAGSAGEPAWGARASKCLTLASVLIPGGFLLGGIVVHEGDPWIGVLLVPIGALALAVGVLTVVLGLSKGPDENGL